MRSDSRRYANRTAPIARRGIHKSPHGPEFLVGLGGNISIRTRWMIDQARGRTVIRSGDGSRDVATADRRCGSIPALIREWRGNRCGAPRIHGDSSKRQSGNAVIDFGHSPIYGFAGFA